MRKILFGGVLTGFAFASFLYSGCGGDDNTGGGGTSDGGGKDVTTTDTGGGQDTAPPPDNYVPPDANPPPPHGKLIIVHASPDAPALRFCYGVGAKDDGSDVQVTGSFKAAPDTVRPNQPYPGLFGGTGGAVPDPGLDLKQIAITPFVIPAALIKGETADAGPDGGSEDTCTALVGPNGKGGILQPGPTGFIQFPTIPAQTVLPATTTLIAAIGCLPIALDPTASTTRCGTDYTDAGNLKLLLLKLDRKTTSGKVGIQVAHAASALDGIASNQNGGAPVIQVTSLLAADGGPVAEINGPDAGLTFSKLLPATAAAVDPAGMAPDSIFVVTTVLADGGAVGSLPLPLSLIAKLTNGTGVSADGGAYFSSDQNYAFVILGDPSAGPLVGPDGGLNLYAPHVIAFPTDPPLPATF